jgi:hypothetical protein
MFTNREVQPTHASPITPTPASSPTPPLTHPDYVPAPVAGCAELNMLEVPGSTHGFALERSQVGGSPASTTAPSTGVALLAACTNAGTLGGIGSAMVTCLDAPISSFVFGGITALTAFNTFQSVRATAEPCNVEPVPRGEQRTRTGLTGFIREIFQAPGVFSACQGITYLGTAIFEITQGRVPQAIAFGSMGLGAFSVYHLVNQGYQPEARQPLRVELAARALYSSLSHGAQDVLKNPGVYFPAANVLLIASATNFATMSTAMMVVFAVSCTISSIGVVVGLAPLVSKHARKQSGFSMIMAGINDFVLAGASLSAGINPTGIATAFWGASALSGAIARIRSQHPAHVEHELPTPSAPLS